jgi:hypothetical protein
MNSSEAGPITIKTDQPNVKVSWQVTGVRQDPFATMQRIVAEEDKPDNERGFYSSHPSRGRALTVAIAPEPTGTRAAARFHSADNATSALMNREGHPWRPCGRNLKPDKPNWTR